MANVDRLKRRMLHELVQQNVDLIHRSVPPMRRASGGPLLRHLRSLGISPLQALKVAAMLAAVVASTALTTASGLVAPLHFLGTLNPFDHDARRSPAAAETAAARAVPPASVRPVAAAVQDGTPALSADAGSAGPTPATLRAAGSAAAPGTPALDAAVLPLAVRTIALDAGHGGDSHGSSAPLGLREKDITLDVAQRLRPLLEANHAFQVIMTREDDAAVSLAERAAIANRRGADIFVSVHVNWIEDRASHGVETYYLGPTDDPFLNRLATVENRDSGYSLADTRQLLDRIYAGVRQDKSRQLAEMVQTSLFRSLGKVNPRIESRGVKSAPFLVLVGTQMPAILAEVSCLSNADEASLLAKPLYRQYIAEALAKGLRDYATLAAGAGNTAGGLRRSRAATTAFSADAGSASPAGPRARLR
jgi:N-acetylmuramoyl-L-alanine amidase